MGCLRKNNKFFIKSKNLKIPDGGKRVDKSASNCYTNYIRKQKRFVSRKFSRTLFQVLKK